MTTWSTLTWTTARAGGITAYVLLTLSMVLGLILSMRWQRTSWPRLLSNELHSYLTLMTLVFIGVHSVAVLLDPYTKFGLQDILVPLAAHYRTAWVALGIIGTYLALAVWISTQLRPFIGFALWRKLHFFTFLVYVLSTLHGIGAGSDTTTPWAMAMYGASVLVVGLLLSVRLLQPSKKAEQGHPMLAGVTMFSMVLGSLWAINGPLHAGPGAARSTTNATTTQSPGSPATQLTVPSTQPSIPATVPGGDQGVGDGTRHHHDDGGYQGGGGGDQGGDSYGGSYQ